MLPLQEQQRLTNTVQMRVKGCTQPAATTLIRLVELHENFMAELFNILPTPPYTKGAIAEGERVCCDDHTKEAFEPRQINDIRGLFIRLVGKETANRIFREIELWQALAAGTQGGALDSPLKVGRMQAITASIRNTWEKAKRAWESFTSRSPSRASKHPLNLLLLEVKPELDWIQVLNGEGYTLVRDKISKQFLPQIMQIVNDGLTHETPLSWGEIATQLKQQVGVKGRYHWERIVRTEMAKAIESGNDRQAKAMGVPYQKWSASILSANICAQCSALNGNIYPVGQAPARPIHPNCRCTVVPTWEAPK